jgi:NAD(P)-dependent dehydrogenase (short-subunit alcohol dehydrogenase family)
VNDLPSNDAGVRSLVKEIESAGGKATSFIANVVNHSEVKDMVHHTVDVFGSLHVMVANAGISKVKPILEQTERDVREMMDVNFMGVFHCYTLAAKQMIRQQQEEGVKLEPGRVNAGKIIGAASLAAFRPFQYLAHYAASKHAVRGFTQGLALEIAKHNITVNAYAPGIVDTPMWEESDREMGRREGKKPRETLEELVGSVALGRLSTGDDVAKTVSFLASTDSDYMTGQVGVLEMFTPKIYPVVAVFVLKGRC